MADRIAELTLELHAEIERVHAKKRQNGGTFTPIMKYNVTIMTMHDAGYSAEKITNFLQSRFKFRIHRSTVARMISRLNKVDEEC